MERQQKLGNIIDRIKSSNDLQSAIEIVSIEMESVFEKFAQKNISITRNDIKIGGIKYTDSLREQLLYLDDLDFILCVLEDNTYNHCDENILGEHIDGLGNMFFNLQKRIEMIIENFKE